MRRFGQVGIQPKIMAASARVPSTAIGSCTRTDADIVLGLDTSLTERAKQTGLFAPLTNPTPALDLPIHWADEVFLPYDWGYFSFVYDNTKLPTIALLIWQNPALMISKSLFKTRAVPPQGLAWCFG